MNIRLNRTPNDITRQARNEINQNWETIENNFNNVVSNTSMQAFNQVVNSARLTWQAPVDTFADLATTYPNPEESWTVMTRQVTNGVSNIYRYNGTSWQLIQQIVTDAISEVDNRLSNRITLNETNIDIVKGPYLYTQDFGVVGDGVTDDTLAMQRVIDAAINLNRALTIIVRGNVLINGTLLINRDRGRREIIRIQGPGSLVKNNAGYMFTSSNTDRAGGNFEFSQLTFRSVINAGTTIVEGGRLLRLYFNECDFIGVDGGIRVPDNSPVPYNYIQTIYFIDCKVIGGAGFFIEAPQAFDTSFAHSLIEHRVGGGIRIVSSESVRIYDSIIEDTQLQAFVGRSGRNLTYEKIYMESCGLSGTPYFELTSNSQITVNSGSVTYRDNLIIGSAAQVADNNYYAVQVVELFKNFNIFGNSFDVNAYRVTRRYTITQKFLRAALTERITNNKFAVNNTLPRNVVNEGNGNIIPNAIAPFSRIAGQNLNMNTTGANAISSANLHLQFFSSVEVPDLILRTSNFLLLNGIDYTIGLQGYSRQLGSSQRSLIVSVFNANTNNSVYEYVLDWNLQNNANINDFYPLQHFTVPTSTDYYLTVRIDSRSGNVPANSGMYINQIVLQTGHVANPASVISTL